MNVVILVYAYCHVMTLKLPDYIPGSITFPMYIYVYMFIGYLSE